MKHINIKATFPGCGKSYTLQKLYSKDQFKRKYYITPQNKQVADVVDRLKSTNCLNPNVQTYAHFVGNWQVIKVEDQTFYIMTDKPSKRAPTKKQIDLFVDEYSSLSKKQIDLLVKHFNIRNLITAGDANQFEPIPYHNVVYENGSRTKILVEYHDDGSLSDLPIDRQYVLTETKRANDPALNALINAVKNADAETIMSVITSRLWNKTKRADDLHIAYTNKVVDAVNNDYVNEFTNKQYIVKNNDKQFGLLKGTLCDETAYQTYIELKRNVFQAQFNDNELNTTVDEALDAWTDYMFGYSYGVTSHKLQGADVYDRNIIIHLEDILTWAASVKSDKTLTFEQKQDEMEKRMSTFHKMIYVAVSRAQHYSQIYFAEDDIIYDGTLFDALNYIDPFEDDNIDDAIYTTSELFDYDECFSNFDNTDLKNYNTDIMQDAINMSYKDFYAKHQLSIGTYKRLRKQASNTPSDMGSRNVAYKETLRDPYFKPEANNIHTLASASSSLLSPESSWCVGDHKK